MKRLRTLAFAMAFAIGLFVSVSLTNDPSTGFHASVRVSAAQAQVVIPPVLPPVPPPIVTPPIVTPPIVTPPVSPPVVSNPVPVPSTPAPVADTSAPQSEPAGDSSGNSSKFSFESFLQGQAISTGCTAFAEIGFGIYNAEEHKRETTLYEASAYGAACGLLPAVINWLAYEFNDMRDNACTYAVARWALKANNTKRAQEELLWEIQGGDSSWSKRQEAIIEKYKECYKKRHQKKRKKNKKRHSRKLPLLS